MKSKFIFSWLPLWAVPVLIGMGVGTVWLRLTIVRTTYAISQTDRMISNLEAQREQEELKLTSLRSPRRLEEIARTRYGLTQPHADQVIHLGAIARAQ